jgi:hypothetical protein
MARYLLVLLALALEAYRPFLLLLASLALSSPGPEAAPGLDEAPL